MSFALFLANAIAALGVFDIGNPPLFIKIFGWILFIGEAGFFLMVGFGRPRGHISSTSNTFTHTYDNKPQKPEEPVAANSWNNHLEGHYHIDDACPYCYCKNFGVQTKCTIRDIYVDDETYDNYCKNRTVKVGKYWEHSCKLCPWYKSIH